jgi:hypothetical protein
MTFVRFVTFVRVQNELEIKIKNIVVGFLTFYVIVIIIYYYKKVIYSFFNLIFYMILVCSIIINLLKIDFFCASLKIEHFCLIGFVSKL